MRENTVTTILAVAFALFGVVALFVWIPNDIEGGFIETFRRQRSVGDAMAPTVVAIAIIVVSVLMGVISFLARKKDATAIDGPDLKSRFFSARIGAILIASLVVMVFAGPLTVDVLNLLGFEVGTYRALRDTIPFKYIGYALGGFLMVFGIIRVIENRTTRTDILTSIFTVIALILLYDVPFDDLLLPPNGDQ